MIEQKKLSVMHGSEAGFIRCLVNAEFWLVVALFVVSLILALQTIGHGGALESLLLPLALGSSVWAGLRFGLSGVCVVCALLLLTVGYFLFAGAGYFSTAGPREHLLFTAGLVLVFTIVPFFSAIIPGYHRRTAELAMGQRNMMQKIFDALPIGIWVRGRAGETVLVNERWANFSSLSPAEIMASGSTAAPVDLGERWEEERRALFNSDDGAVRYQGVELEDSCGTRCSMTLLTLKVYIDQLEDVGTLSLLVDETALRLYEEKIRTSEHRLRMALENVDMGFWRQDLDTGQIYRDANWYRILDLNAEEESDATEVWESRMHPDDHERVLSDFSDFLKSDKEMIESDYRIRKKGGEYIWVQNRVRVVERSTEGEPKQIMGTMQDISEHKRIEMDLMHAKDRAEAGNRAKGHFIATISHEIRTPLNAIIGLSSFLSEGGLEEDQLDLAQTIYSSGKSLLLLVNDILDFSKIESGRLDLEVQEFPLRLCFEDCVKLFKIRAAEKNVDLQLSLASDLTEFAWGDMERLRQIVQNLLANALKFTDAGEVEISVEQVAVYQLPADRRPDPLEPIGYLDQPDHHYIQVCVRDSGIGIPEDRQHVLFEAFSQVDPSTTRKYGGTGLGLAICKRLVHAMGGVIWVESNEGEGAVFGFVFRTKLIGEVSEIQKETRSPFDPQHRISEEHPCDILIVGDKDKSSRLLVSCRKLGYAPHHAPSYDLSSDAFQRRRYNLIFIWMSDEESGLKLSRKLSEATGSSRSSAIVGVVPAGRAVSQERSKLAGMRCLVEECPSSEIIRGVILDVLCAHG